MAMLVQSDISAGTYRADRHCGEASWWQRLCWQPKPGFRTSFLWKHTDGIESVWSERWIRPRTLPGSVWQMVVRAARLLALTFGDEWHLQGTFERIVVSSTGVRVPLDGCGSRIGW